MNFQDAQSTLCNIIDDAKDMHDDLHDIVEDHAYSNHHEINMMHYLRVAYEALDTASAVCEIIIRNE